MEVDVMHHHVMYDVYQDMPYLSSINRYLANIMYLVYPIL